ncbi:lipase 1-like [Anopheles nili]|uniref:lipase 1-like n=1 Tax=Anopheles nili TaxID=185578 RepID=UPI00237AE3D0|nr:lipase 1-like [Anopheles nili]
MSHLQVELIQKYGYRGRAYTVTTADGYELGVHRLQRKGGRDPNLLPVLIVHGLLGSSADWVLIGPDAAIGYLLADAGHDVWLGNTRGNRYSRRHFQMSPDDVAFWNFSWHEKGMYDVPAMIDFILNESKPRYSQLYYIGYSEGTTAYFVMTSSLPEYRAKIRLAHALAPAVLLDEMRSPILTTLANASPSLILVGERSNFVELFPWSEMQNGFLRSVCQPFVERNPCALVFENAFGPNQDSLDMKVVQAMMGHCPSGAALKEPKHYNQVIHTGIFQPYQEEGMENTVTAYNISASDVPIYIYYGVNDWIVHPKNVRRFANELPNVREIRPVGGKKFTHIDFFIGKHVKPAVYNRILRNLRNDARAQQAK